MSEHEDLFKKEELREMYASGDVQPFEDLYMVEDAALQIKDIEERVDFYKAYKKKKINDVQNAIQVLSNQVSFFKQVILSTLKKFKQKSIKFPGSCSVQSRKQGHKWIINDSDEFIRLVREAKSRGESVAGVIEEVVQYNIVKKEADKLLDVWEQNGTLDDILKKTPKGAEPVISKEPEAMTVAFKFEEESQPEEDSDAAAVVVPMKKDGSPISDEDFDRL